MTPRARSTSARRSPTETTASVTRMPRSSSTSRPTPCSCFGVDDSEKIWVNGSRVFEQFTARGLVVDQDRVPVRLKAGTNTILLKLYQNTLGWEFCVRIATPDGRAVPFIQKTE